MDKVVEKAHEDMKQPTVFFDAVDELMRTRDQISRDKLKEIQQDENSNPRIRAAAHVLDEHFDDIHHMSDPPKNIDSFFGDYHKQLFEEENPPFEALTKRELSIVRDMFDRDKEKSYMNWSTYGRVALEGLATLGNGVGAFAFGAGAVTDPEPVTKGWCALISGALTLDALHYGINLFEPAGTLLQNEYSRRQQMIDSWQFFKEKAEH